VEQRTPQPAVTLNQTKTPWRLLALLMTMTAVGSMALNILVPAVPRLAEVMASDKETIQLTISLYVLGLAMAQLVTGPLSDRFGRRPVILTGFALATLASLGAIAMSNAAGLITMRLIQAIGGATGVAIGRAIIRDMFGRERSAQMIGLVASAMAIAPMISPLIGGLLDTWFGWESIFLFAATVSGLVFVWTWRTLPETRSAASEAASESGFLTNMLTLLRSPRYVGYVLSAGLGSGAFFVYVGGGPHVIISIMHRTPWEYGLWFIPAAGGYIIGNLITSRLSMRYGIDGMLGWGNVVNIIGAAIGIVLIYWVDFLGPLTVVIPAAIMGIGNGVLLPNAIAGAVSIRPQIAGTASGLLGCLQMSFGAFTTQLAVHVVAGATSVTPLVLHMFAVGAGAMLVYLLLLWPGMRKGKRV
jgi:DHA1 family bicyclomycin/chloramphenicol resistance-like MFS transporter